MKRRWMYAIAGLVLTACGEQVVSEAELTEKEAKIRAMIGDASCDDVDSCASIAFGAKPCGGPWEYLVYCTDSVDEDALQKRVDEYFELNQKYNAENGIVSDCAMVEEPELLIYQGICMIAEFG